jgi:rhodanese-related sulfurtransferase
MSATPNDASDPSRPTDLPAEVDVREVADLLARGAALLDVREPYEWNSGHAPAAVHVPLGQLTLKGLPAGRPLLVICHVGGRSAAAVAALLRAGVEAVNVGGGMESWAAAGMPVLDEAGGPGRVV